MVTRGRLTTALAGLAMAVCALPGFAAATPADEVLTSALSAARAQQSVHYEMTAASTTVRVTMVGDAARDRGIQRITYSKGGESGRVTVLVVADTAYVRGDAFTLSSFMGFSSLAARQHAGRWLKVPRTASWYPTVSAAVRLNSLVEELTLPQPRTLLPQSLLDGQRVVGIRSSSTSSGRRVTGTLYVQASGLRLPVAQKLQQGADRITVSFSDWNLPVTVAAPPRARLLA